MSRGRAGRRGQYPGLNPSCLRDTVKKRLFDQNGVPSEPNIATLLSKLKPVHFVPYKVHSLIIHANSAGDAQTIKTSSGEPVSKSAATESNSASSNFLSSVFHMDCLISYVNRSGPDFHRFARREEGISQSVLTASHCKSASQLEDEGFSAFSALHLLMDRDNVEKWEAINKNLAKRYNPARWYPKDLIMMIKKATRKPLKTTTTKRAKTGPKRKSIVQDDIEDEVAELENAESAVERAELELEAKQATDNEDADDVIRSPKRRSKAAFESDDEDDDPEDARWNGRQNKSNKKDDQANNAAASDPEEDEEEENDYCEDYFDNGEGDAFDNVRMDDGEGDVEDYYD